MQGGDDIRLMFDSKYIGAWDLLGRDVTVTIEKVKGAIIEGEGGKKDRAPVVSFKGWPKGMVLNKTNLKTIGAMYGSYNVKDWIGKRITLYATTCKGARGGTVDCIRVRPNIPDKPGVPQSAVGLVPVDQEMRRNQVEQSGETVTGRDEAKPAREPGED